jgi:branched-chain amino acid transport system ATP-binding protein
MTNTTPQNPLFRITGLTHAFGGLMAVSDFNLAMQAGQIRGLIGPNGAGKTTVFNLITGVYKQDKGSVMLSGKNLAGLPSNVIVSRGISRTFQNIRLFKSMTVLDNVITAAYCRLDYSPAGALFRSKQFKRREASIRKTALETLDAFGLGDRADEIAARLPYGLQRKVELARALVSRPAVLLLDEPGAGMNPSELGDLVDMISWVRDTFGVAIALIEHRMQLVMNLCDRVTVLNFGETIFEGLPADLAKDQAVVRAYFGEDHDDIGR